LFPFPIFTVAGNSISASDHLFNFIGMLREENLKLLYVCELLI
jgi:hypothetical protein